MMEGNVSASWLSPDQPLHNPKDDRLGYADFARLLAKAIYGMAPPEGLVMALYGPWGSGKTSLLNFVEHIIRDIDPENYPIVMRFNPWWFSDHSDLVRHFFQQLQSTLTIRKIQIDKLRKLVRQLAELASDVPIQPVSLVGKVAARLSHPAEKDVPTLKKAIADQLIDLNRRILVMVDDVDRLTSDDIAQVFRVIKAVADFPNVVYLLAFDKQVVVKALEKHYDGTGESYLEKIVQVPFEMPDIEKETLRSLLFANLERILSNTPEDLFDEDRWTNVFFSGLDRLFSTPRDVIRVSNALSVTYPSLVGEVNAVDFVSMEILRILVPELYILIRDNKSYFIGPAQEGSGYIRHDREELRKFHNGWLEQLPEEVRQVRRSLEFLFPKLESVWSNTYYGLEWESTWRRERRVCSLDVVDIYFRWALSRGRISNREMKAILEEAAEPQEFRDKLLGLANRKKRDGRTYFQEFIERWEDHIDAISKERIPGVVEVLFNIGDDILRAEGLPGSSLELRTETRILRVVGQLLRRLPEPIRYEILESAIGQEGSVFMAVLAVIVFGQQQGKHGVKQSRPKDEWMVSAQHLEALEMLVIAKIKEAANSGNLISAPYISSVLGFWSESGGEQPVRNWVSEVVKTDEGLVQILESFLTYYSIHTVGRLAIDRVPRLDPKWLEPYLDVDRIVDRARMLVRMGDRWTERQQVALHRFIEEYEIRQSGRDPNYP